MYDFTYMYDFGSIFSGQMTNVDTCKYIRHANICLAKEYPKFAIRACAYIPCFPRDYQKAQVGHRGTETLSLPG